MKPLTPASPHAIIMVGIPGAGKSTFAERFADTFQAPILNRTKLKKELSLDDDQSDSLIDTILVQYLKTNRTIVIEGGVDRKASRAALSKVLNKAGYKPLIVWVQTDANEAHRRATKEYPKGSGITTDEFDSSLKDFQAPVELERAVVISGKHTYTTQVKVVLKQLASENERPIPPRETPPEPPRQPRGRTVLVR